MLTFFQKENVSNTILAREFSIYFEDDDGNKSVLDFNTKTGLTLNDSTNELTFSDMTLTGEDTLINVTVGSIP